MKINNKSLIKNLLLSLVAVFCLGFAQNIQASASSTYWKNYFSIEERKAVEKNTDKYTRKQIEEKSKKWKGIIRGYNIKNGSITGDDIKDNEIGLDKIKGLDDYLGQMISSGTTDQDFSASKLTGSYAGLDGSGITNLNPGNFSQGEFKKFVFENGTSAPISPVSGQAYFNTETKKPQWYDATNERWRSLPQEATFIVAASDSRNKEGADYICDGIDDNIQIQAALDALSGGGKVQLLEGTYIISSTVTTSDYSVLSGVGWGTVIDASALMGAGDDTSSPLTMGDNTRLVDLKIQGDTSTVPASWNETVAGNDSIIERIWIDQMGTGINTTNKQNVHINDCKFTNIRNSWGWASAIHNSGTSKNIFIKGVYISDSDRGIETENGASNIYASDGYIYNVIGTESFVLDVHTHAGYGNVSNVVYQNFYLENTSEITVVGKSATDMMENITIRNITMKNPAPKSGEGLVHITYAEGVLIDNVKIFGDALSQSNVIIATSSTNVVFNKLDVTNLAQSNLIFTNSVGIAIENSKFAGTGGYLVSLKNGNGILFDNVLFDKYITNGGLQIESTCSNIYVTNSTFIGDPDAPGNYAIASQSDYTKIENSTFLGQTPPYKYPVRSVADYARIYGNYFTGQIKVEATSDETLIYGNDFTGGGGVTDAGIDTKTYNNSGYTTATSNTTTITSGNTYVAVTHSLDITPEAKNISVTPTNSMGSATKFWISDIDLSSFRINVDQDPGEDATFSWSIRDN